MSGIYFLIKNGEIIYIGKSKNLRFRVKSYQHDFYDCCRLIQCPANLIGQYEKRLISYFKPIYNCHHNPNNVKVSGIHVRKKINFHPKAKETRGRKGKFPKINLKVKQVAMFPLEKGLQSSVLNQAKVRGWTLRTWHDEGELVVLRTK